MGKSPAEYSWAVVSVESLWGGPVSWQIEITSEYFELIFHMDYLLIHIKLGSLLLDTFIHLLFIYLFIYLLEREFDAQTNLQGFR
jgi:hypothetical protein